jgi:hypothetical protein
MTHASNAALAPSRPREGHRLFFKADHPRAIDRYIDYFGGVGGYPAALGNDRCGETLLERLA